MKSEWHVIEGLTAFSAIMTFFGVIVIVLNILLFLKLWNMTDDVRKIREMAEFKIDKDQDGDGESLVFISPKDS